MGRQTLQRDYQDGVVAYSREITYNAKSQVIEEVTNTKQGADIYRAETAYDYGSGVNYALGSPLVVTTVNFKNDQEQKTSEVVNAYAWGDGPMQSELAYDGDLDSGSNPINTSTYTYATVGGSKQLTQASIIYGRSMSGGLGAMAGMYLHMANGARTVDYRNDLSGQAIKRDESDSHTTGDPHEVWHRFAGKQMGFVGNNGTADADYEFSIYSRVMATGSGPTATARRAPPIPEPELRWMKRDALRPSILGQVGVTMSIPRISLAPLYATRAEA